MIVQPNFSGTTLPALTNPGAAADLLSGKQLIDQDGNIVTGSMASVSHPNPSISVSSSGLITASHTQSSGKVTGGTTSATRQLTTQAAKTVTPGTSSQTAVASGRYTTGAVTVAGSSNLVASNIKSGVNIFGVTGTFEGESVETVTVTNELPITFLYCSFIDGSGQFHKKQLINQSETIEIQKNSILYVEYESFGIPDRGATFEISENEENQISVTGDVNGTPAAAFVTKNVTIR